MVSLPQLQAFTASQQYRCQANLDLYDSPALETLATQAKAGRQLCVSSLSGSAMAVEVRLCEDSYPGWLAIAKLEQLDVADTPYRAIALPEPEIRSRITDAIDFAEAAMSQPNEYLWGGTVGPDYDCSGLIQTAFAAVGIWLPRDAYQQEAFLQPVWVRDWGTAPALPELSGECPVLELLPGDLVFFGQIKATHVGLYLGDDRYIHSSGKDQGRNGIGVDRLSGQGDTTSQAYHAQLRSIGRVASIYQPR